MTDQENNLVGCVNPDGADKLCKGLPNITWRFVTAMAKGVRPFDAAGMAAPQRPTEPPS